MKLSSWFLVLAPLAFVAFGCQAGGVGDPCIPEDEYQQGFTGYSVTEVNVESRSFQCETRVCLVNHFQGRVSCPYGQTEEEVAGWEQAPNWRAPLCAIPGTNGNRNTDRISVPVQPQKYRRRASEAVYCSCRCANADGNTDDGARYCDCPNGYECEHLIDDVGLGSTQLAGAYCIKKGTRYNEAEAEASPDCVPQRRHPSYCGESRPY
jgi:hypothetical protein